MPHPPRCRYSLLFCLTLCLFVWAGPASAEPNEELEFPNESTVPTRVDMTHRDISEKLHRTTQWFDNFFNDPRIDAEPAGTRLRLRGSIIMEEGEGPSFKSKIKANVELPNLESRYQLILSNEDDNLREETDPETPADDRLATTDQSTSIGLQYTKQMKQNFIYSNRLSVRWDEGLNPRVRTRGRYTLDLTERSLLNLTQSFFWEKVDGFGQENRIDYDFLLSKNNLLRSTLTGVYSEVSNGYEWVIMQQLLVLLSHKKAFTFGAFAVGETEPGKFAVEDTEADNKITDYVLFTEYRQSFIKKWLFFELRPEVNWQREKDYNTNLAFTATLEVRFGY